MIFDPWKIEWWLLSQFCQSGRALFRFTAICGLVPLYALLTVSRRGQHPSRSTGTHPQSLKAPALGANADVAAAPGDQGRLLRQSVGEGLGQPRAPAQLPVAEADGGGPRPALLQR